MNSTLEWVGIGPRPIFTPATACYALLPHVLLVFALLLPPTSRLRPAIFTPLILSLFWTVNAHFSVGPPFNNAGLGIMCAFWSCRVVELLLVFPPDAEQHGVQRVLAEALPPLEQHGRKVPSVGTSPTSADSTLHPPLLPALPAPSSRVIVEPVPPPYTVAKFLWAADLWSNYRGIGWTYQAPLSKGALRHPFLRTSRVRAFLVNRVGQLLFTLVVVDVLSTLLAVEPRTRDYFSAIEGVSPRLAHQPVLCRALWSISVVAWTWQGLELSYVATAISMVSVGAVTGWKGAMWEPFGWPPLFGTLGELWNRPGLAMMWSRTWHHYFRRVLFSLAWVGLGEHVLGLTTTSTSPPPSTASTPTLDGNSTNLPPPAVPIAPIRPSSHLLANLTKSLLVFCLTGLLHECGNLSVGPVLPALHSHTKSLPLIGTTTLFFAVQPVGIGVEAVVKAFWRQWKGKHGGKLGKHTQTLERAVGFCWTWWWLGSTAAWVVEDWSKRGFYSAKLAEWSVIRWFTLGTFWV